MSAYIRDQIARIDAVQAELNRRQAELMARPIGIRWWPDLVAVGSACVACFAAGAAFAKLLG